MDDDQFDRVTRHFSVGATRRALLGAVAGLIPSLEASAKKGHDVQSEKKKKKKKKPCRECQKRKKGRCRPAPDGTPCSGGTCTAGACRGGGGQCSVGGQTASLVTETQFQGKTLRLQQTANLETSGTQAEVTLGGDFVLRQVTEIAAPGVVITMTFGPAFSGIDRVRLATDGQTVTGEIDGRAIQPLPVNADPSQMRFADGGPALDVQVDAGLAEAIKSLFQLAGQQSGSCRAARTARQIEAEAGRGSPECLLAMGTCAADAFGCVKTAVGFTTACSAIFGPLGGLVCGLVSTVYCAYTSADCLRDAGYGPDCCPIRCGGNVDNILGPNPLCCPEGKTCLDPNSNRECCAAGTSGCNGVCCPNGSCKEGICCTPGVGKICGNRCCPPLDTCCGGVTCCTGTCVGSGPVNTRNICCPSVGHYACPKNDGSSSACCPNDVVCCDGRCCGPGQACQNNQCVASCPFTCNGQCCQQGDVCCGGGGPGSFCTSPSGCPR